MKLTYSSWPVGLTNNNCEEPNTYHFARQTVSCHSEPNH